MTKGPIHSEDGSPLREEATTERPFTHPMPTGELDNEGNPVAESAPNPIQDSREAIMEAAANRADEERTIAPGTRQEDMPMGEPVPDQDPDLDEGEGEDLPAQGLTEKETFGTDESEKEGALPAEYADDPLAEYIQMEDDQPMLRTKINGNLVLIPLDDARAELQKRAAGAQRLQMAADREKELEQREANVAAAELQIQNRLGNQPAEPSAPDAQPLDDETLETRAREAVSGLFTGSEDEAAAKLAELLKDVRGASATPVDPDALVAQAVAATREQLSTEERNQDIQEGFAQFQSDYPEIAEDDTLFKFADSMIPAIEQEHPDWKPSQVMLEAGSRVRKWMSEKTGTPEPSDPPQQETRQERKRNLRPMPTTRQGHQEKEPEEEEETPASVLRGIREARGQA